MNQTNVGVAIKLCIILYGATFVWFILTMVLGFHGHYSREEILWAIICVVFLASGCQTPSAKTSYRSTVDVAGFFDAIEHFDSTIIKCVHSVVHTATDGKVKFHIKIVPARAEPDQSVSTLDVSDTYSVIRLTRRGVRIY